MIGNNWGLTPEPWIDQAICHQTDPEAFFPDQGGSVHLAKAVCVNCPVAQECLEFALRNGELFGIWGGMTYLERRRLRRHRRAVAVLRDAS